MHKTVNIIYKTKTVLEENSSTRCEARTRPLVKSQVLQFGTQIP